MKMTVRNVLRGKVLTVTHGAVDSEIVIELTEGLEVVAIITRRSAEALDLAVGSDACAVFQAAAVMIAVD